MVAYTAPPPTPAVLSEQVEAAGRPRTQASGYDTMVTFLRLFTNKKSFQSASVSLPGKQGMMRCAPAPTPALAAGPHTRTLTA